MLDNRGFSVDEDGDYIIDAAYLQGQREWSEDTFGPGNRTEGVVEHIIKELTEIVGVDFVREVAGREWVRNREMTPDPSEFVDVVILALDGLWRAGYEPQETINAIVTKQMLNETRKWPDWRTFTEARAIEHVRE